ncbi:MAG: hypothetical protein ACYCT7_05980 [bacterium]|jgi:predicted DNA-binding protein
MPTVTIRVPEDKRDILKIIASVEKREMKDIVSELIDGYIEMHQETLNILSNPEWVKLIKQGKEEVQNGIKGKTLAQLDD